MKFLTHVIFGLFYVQTEAWNISEQLQKNVSSGVWLVVLISVLGILIVVLIVVVCCRKRKSSMRLRESSRVVEDSPGPVAYYRRDDSAECEPYSITRVMEQPQVPTHGLSAGTQTSTHTQGGHVTELRFHGDVDVIKQRDAEGRTCLLLVERSDDVSRAVTGNNVADEYLTTVPRDTYGAQGGYLSVSSVLSKTSRC